MRPAQAGNCGKIMKNGAMKAEKKEWDYSNSSLHQK